VDKNLSYSFWSSTNLLPHGRNSLSEESTLGCWTGVITNRKMMKREKSEKTDLHNMAVGDLVCSSKEKQIAVYWELF
jgi:hypothetical protein